MARIQCTPNPAVGAVLVDADGHILGMGHTQRPGGDHAEIMALRDATAKGHETKGATIYVSLEPCSHHGRTGPCTDALIQAGIGKVVASVMDPNPLVAGQGFEKLRAAGIEVEVGNGAVESQELNIGFFHRMVHKKPWVRLKIAASLDGNTALENGKSQWITSEAAREDGHKWRSRSCAILTGIGTILDDDPRLNVRLKEGGGNPRQPSLIVVDSMLQTPIEAKVFDTDRSVLIYTTTEDVDKAAALKSAGATVIRLAANSASNFNKVDLALMMEDLGQREINELHVEAGHKLNGSLLKAELVDEMIVYMAPMMMGAGLPMAHIGSFSELTQIKRFDFVSANLIGPDLRVIARLQNRDWFGQTDLSSASL